MMVESDPKFFDKLESAFKDIERRELKVGWFEAAKYESGTPVAYVASIQEFGVPERSIPARPFMRPTYIAQINKWRALLDSLIGAALEGKTTITGIFDIVGKKIVADIRATIESITSPPLSPITLGARKYRREGKEVTGATIGEIAQLLKEDKLDISGVPAKPLDDTHFMITTLAHITESAK